MERRTELQIPPNIRVQVRGVNRNQKHSKHNKHEWKENMACEEGCLLKPLALCSETQQPLWGDRESSGGEALLGRGRGPCGLERDALGVVRISWLLR